MKPHADHCVSKPPYTIHNYTSTIDMTLKKGYTEFKTPQGKCMSKTAVTECRIFFTNGKFAEKDGLTERRCPRALRTSDLR